jgi:DNA-binding GntR family transcriptional regulator
MTARRRSSQSLKRPRQRKIAINRDPLHIQVADRLRDMIVHGDLKPGEKVPFAMLAADLGVSLTPLREAFKVLAEDGLVEQTPNRGVRILPYTAEEASALFEVIAALESLAARLATLRMSDADLAGLEALHERMREEFASRSKDSYFDINSLIHERIVSLSGNDVLIGTHTKLMVRANRGRYIAIVKEDRWREAMEEHEAVMDAFRRRDSEAAGAIWQIHLMRSGEVVSTVLKQHAAGERDDDFERLAEEDA